MINTQVPTIDICIATYKRPTLLNKLLNSVTSQITEGQFTYDIIVADNDRDQSARRVVSRFGSNCPKITYTVEPEQNISLARNRALSLANAEYIATIDDDEVAHNQWLLNLYKTLISYNADVVFGPVYPIFPRNAPVYVIKSKAFTLPNPPTGTSHNFVCITGNSLFKRKLIEHLDTPFDPAFGKTGGGDTAFFEDLRKMGSSQVWCREAPVFHFIPPDRANCRWVLKRDFRTGNVKLGVSDYELVDPHLPKASNIFTICKKLLRPSLIALLYGFVSVFNRKYAIQAFEFLRRISFNIGVIAYLLGHRYFEYREK